MAQIPLDENLDIVARSDISVTIDPLTKDLNIIQKLDDEPNDVGGMSAQELKETFDRAGNIIKSYINDSLVPQCLSEGVTEQTRVANENQRKANETARQSAESARVTAENARKSAESSRVTAENSRKVIGEHGPVGPAGPRAILAQQAPEVIPERLVLRGPDFPLVSSSCGLGLRTISPVGGSSVMALTGRQTCGTGSLSEVAGTIRWGLQAARQHIP